jgi:hypothetical protein
MITGKNFPRCRSINITCPQTTQGYCIRQTTLTFKNVLLKPHGSIKFVKVKSTKLSEETNYISFERHVFANITTQQYNHRTAGDSDTLRKGNCTVSFWFIIQQLTDNATRSDICYCQTIFDTR